MHGGSERPLGRTCRRRVRRLLHRAAGARAGPASGTTASWAHGSRRTSSAPPGSSSDGARVIGSDIDSHRRTPRREIGADRSTADAIGLECHVCVPSALAGPERRGDPRLGAGRADGRQIVPTSAGSTRLSGARRILMRRLLVINAARRALRAGTSVSLGGRPRRLERVVAGSRAAAPIPARADGRRFSAIVR